MGEPICGQWTGLAKDRVKYHMKKFIWDTSALLNIKEPGDNGYSPALSLYKDLNDGWIAGPYKNIFPSIAYFELSASISRKHREGAKILRDFYILNKNSVIYNIDTTLIKRSNEIVSRNGFDLLRGADLIFACIAYLEDAFLVTLDNHFKHLSKQIRIIDLNKSRNSPEYRRLFKSS